SLERRYVDVRRLDLIWFESPAEARRLGLHPAHRARLSPTESSPPAGASHTQAARASPFAATIRTAPVCVRGRLVVDRLPSPRTTACVRGSAEPSGVGFRLLCNCLGSASLAAQYPPPETVER